MNNVLITGGSGFVGGWLAKQPPRNKMITLLNQQAYDNGSWDDGQWKYIIHLAPVPVDRVLECAKRCNATVMLASSGGVYDRNLTDYFQMKLDDENKLLSSGLNVKIARIFTTCGAGMKWERYAIGNFIKQAAAGGPINVQSYGMVVRSYLYGSDLAEWLWAILLDGDPGGVYNVGSDVPHSTRELAFQIAGYYAYGHMNAFGPQVNIERRMGPEPRPFYVPDVYRAQYELGLTVKVDFAEAVKRTVEDYRREN